jgi:hypothetical protein
MKLNLPKALKDKILFLGEFTGNFYLYLRKDMEIEVWMFRNDIHHNQKNIIFSCDEIEEIIEIINRLECLYN